MTTDIEVLIMESSRVLPLAQKIRDDFEKLIQVI
jgi:hypothetical protein